jgi:hypothetical protein
LGLMSNESVKTLESEEAGPLSTKAKNDKFKLKRKDDLKKHLTNELNNIMLYKTQGSDEVIYLCQKGFDTREIRKTNWVRLIDLG